jgi:hypothetical protein
LGRLFRISRKEKVTNLMGTEIPEIIIIKKERMNEL